MLSLPRRNRRIGLRLSQVRATWRDSYYYDAWLVAAVGGATTFAFAGVLAFAAVVAGLATAFAFAGVLAFAGVNVLLVGLLAHLAERDTSFAVCIGGMRLNGE